VRACNSVQIKVSIFHIKWCGCIKRTNVKERYVSFLWGKKRTVSNEQLSILSEYRKKPQVLMCMVATEKLGHLGS